jgi:hypothetical protein
MGAGRPQKADPGSLYAIAHQFYWDFRRLAEGRRRWTLDTVKLQQWTEELENLDVPAEAAAKADEEILAGRLEASRKQERLRELEEQLSSTRWLWPDIAREEAMNWVKIPGEREVIKELLDPATTPARLRDLCRDAVMTRTVQVEPGVKKEIEIPAWPIPVGSPFPTYLAQYAEHYVAALHDPRFPSCDVSIRPSSRLKQFWFLSRALAGAVFGVSTRTAINLVGSRRPEEIFEDSRDAKPARKRIRRKYKSRPAS